MRYDMIPFSKRDLAIWERLGKPPEYPKGKRISQEKRRQLEKWLKNQIEGMIDLRRAMA